MQSPAALRGCCAATGPRARSLWLTRRFSPCESAARAPPRGTPPPLVNTLPAQIRGPHGAKQRLPGIRRDLVPMLDLPGLHHMRRLRIPDHQIRVEPRRNTPLLSDRAQRASPAPRTSTQPGPRSSSRGAAPRSRSPASRAEATRSRPTRRQSRPPPASSAPECKASDPKPRDRSSPSPRAAQSFSRFSRSRIGGAHLYGVAPSGMSSAAKCR